MDEVTGLKQQAARAAAQLVESGMIVGLGYGSTTHFAVQHLAERLAQGEIEAIVAITASASTASQARRLRIPLTSTALDRMPDITIDGADEVDPHLRLIKGGGGALLHEKILAQASKRLVIIVDETKLSPALGSKFPLPIEVVEFGLASQLAFLETQGARTVIRRDESDSWFRTAEGNLLLDCNFGVIEKPDELAAILDKRAGIVAHGLFVGMADEVIVASPGGIQVLRRG
ncbi:MAG: ribose-5-phosphate isomerase RpiA [Anaerolineae bacterium]|nr:ribose-5-phosphate isomerase RpiA [Anaerolineae bacterium]